MAESFLQNNFAERIGGNMFGKDTKTRGNGKESGR